MIAGRLKYRLQLYRPAGEESIFGMTSGGYTEDKIIRAERVKYIGSHGIELHEVYADYRVSYRIRDAHSFISEGWRLKELGSSVLMEVRNVVPNKERGMLTLECEKVNE